MPPNDDINPLARRLHLRRARGQGFGQGSSTQSESLRIGHNDAPHHVDDDDDDLIDADPVDVHNRIIDRAASAAPPPPVPADDRPPDQRQRMHQVAAAGSAAYAKEYRLDMLRRYLLRRIPIDQIASMMGVSVSTIEKDRAELGQRMREVARRLDINEIVGNQLETYGEISAMALKMASVDATPAAMKLAAMRTTLASEADKTRFLNTAGVFDVLRYRKAEDGSDISDIQLLMNNTSEMFDRLLSMDDEPAAPKAAPRPKRTVRPARAGGFSKMTMDDTDASNSRNEEVNL